MQRTIKQLLIQYWGYNQFRPLQEDIILSVLEKKDTLALLPTGGGKSICYQIPALAKDGICIVISPLIALMKDQVASLKNKGIKAIAIHTGMHKHEIDIALDNCIFGDIKFLYLSPERLKTDIVRERIKGMNVNLLAIDEAHCISQWGYDFRPPYLEIAEIRKIIPNTPVLALTATATPDVIDDIQEKLLFKNKNTFYKSFNRANLTYSVLYEEDKLNRILLILKKIAGSTIIYVRNRKKTKEICEFLKRHNISADYYHAGLDIATRDKKQEGWIDGHSRVIVCTNAFGMGIDKPNVRLVIHFDIPDSIEAYFQEAGRAGRDEKRAIALLLYNQFDIEKLNEYFELAYPSIATIKSIYQALGNYFQITIGAGEMQNYYFDIVQFAHQYRFKPIIVFNALHFLEKEGYIILSDNFKKSSRIYIPITKDELYHFQIANKAYDPFIKTILRSYTGLFTDFIDIKEKNIAQKLNTTEEAITKSLLMLHKYNVIVYEPLQNLPFITYLSPRTESDNIIISEKNYLLLKETARKKLDAIIQYVTSDNKCRNILLLKYLGENTNLRCGTCDYCRNRNKANLSQLDFNQIIDQIKPILKQKELSTAEIINLVKGYSEDKILNAIKWLIDNKKIIPTNNLLFQWHKTNNDKN